MSRDQVFDSEIKNFFDICVKILESHQKSQIISSDNHTLRNLQRYKIVYNMTEVETHIPYFQKLFRTYRDDLYEILKEDKWFMEENLVIQYGEEIEDPELRKRSEKRKIELSTIYKTAVQLRKTFEESVKGLPESAREQSPELTYPQYFLLYLFRIFCAIYPQNKEVQKVVQSLEKDLGMSSASSRKTNNPLLDMAENAKKLLGGGVNGNNNLLQSLLPADLKLPSNEEMSSKLQQAMKDPLVSETLGATMNSVMGAKNIGEGITLALKSLENPKFMEGLLKTVNTLIPAETMNAITKSTEQLKENGEIKNALSSLGLSSEIDISQMLNQQLRIQPSEISSDNVSDSPAVSSDTVEPQVSASPSVPSSAVTSTVTPSSTIVESSGPSGSESTSNEQTQAVETLNQLTSVIPTEMMDMLKNPNLLQMFNQFQQQMIQGLGQPGQSNQASTPTEEKSLIDF
jgi:hypothetical protein